MTAALLITTLVLFSCIVGSRLSQKIGIPALFIFMVLGMLFGSDGILKIPFDNYAFAEQVCSVALIFIMFYGGFGTRWSEARPVAVPALALSSVGVVITALVTGLFCVYVCRMDFWEGMLVGSVLSSTDAASVFGILRSKKLSLKDHTASLLEVESGSNDPFAYMLMTLVLSVMQGKASAGTLVLNVLAQIGFGLAVGVVVAVVAVYVLKRMAFSAMGLHTIYVFTVALFAYAAASVLGGNGYLSVYVAGIIMGNSRLPHQKVLVGFFDAFTGLMQMLIFFLLGLLAFPSRMVPVLLPSFLIALFLTVIARPLAVGLILLPLRRSFPQFALVSWAGLRGAASIVFAIMALVGGDSTQSDIVHIVFCVVLFSIVLQGSLLPWLAKKLHMIDDTGNVLRTFTDYAEESDMQFFNLLLEEGHPWNHKMVRDIFLPPDTILILLRRGDEVIAPRGDTLLLPGDKLVLGALGYVGSDQVELREIELAASHKWCGRTIGEIAPPSDTLIVLVRRGRETLVPSGALRLEPGDTVVLYSLDDA